MESSNLEKGCPVCDYPVVKGWEELTDDQQFVAKRLPASADFTFEERKKHRFCTRCWFEDTQRREKMA